MAAKNAILALSKVLIAALLLSLPAAALAGALDCNMPSSRMETAICADKELLARERAIEAWVLRNAGEGSMPQVRAVAKQSAGTKSECDISRPCLAWFQRFQAIRLQALSGRKLELPPFSDNSDPFLLYFDDYAKMRITIFRREGLDTDQAVITAKHTNREACDGAWSAPSMKCIHEEDLRPLLTFSANCSDGTLHTLYGFERKVTKRDVDEIAIMDIEDNEDLAVTDPQAYKRDLAQFNALCPSGL